MRLDFRDEDIRDAARIARCNPAKLKLVLQRGRHNTKAERNSAMIEAAVIVERRARSARLKFAHQQAHSLELAAKAIRKAAEQEPTEEAGGRT